jgi:hypothetical protein
MRITLLVPLLALGLGACSSDSSSIGVGASAGTSVGGYYGSHYGAYPWWYDDYFNYWDHYYPWCCDHEGDFDELIKKWWNGLDADRQQEIKDKFHDWQDNHGQADLAALRGDFATRWNAMSPEQKQALRDNSKLLPSVSNPDRTPRSPLDYKEGSHPGVGNGALLPATLPKADNGALLPATLPKSDNGMLLPSTLPKTDNGALLPTTPPKADNGMLLPSTLPKTDNGTLRPTTLPKAGGSWTPSAQPRINNGVAPRPHLPSTLASPMSRPSMPQRMAPPMRSFPAMRRR